jgi:hypothetical protein
VGKNTIRKRVNKNVLVVHSNYQSS